MPLLTEGQLALLDKILAKLKERSSISAYAVFIVGLFGVTNQKAVDEFGGGIALVAGALLFLLNDATVRRVLTGKSQPASAEAIEPAATDSTLSAPVVTAAAPEPTEDPSMSLISSISGVFAKLSPVVSAALEAVTLVEALFPDSAGAKKLEAAKAYVAKAAGTAEDATATIEGVLASLKAGGVISSSAASAVPAAAPVVEESTEQASA